MSPYLGSEISDENIHSPKVALDRKLYADKSNSIADICNPAYFKGKPLPLREADQSLKGNARDGVIAESNIDAIHHKL